MEDEKEPGRPYGGASPEERNRRRRRAFLDAGLELFGTRGFRDTSIRALCRAAKLTDRYFYEQFETAEDLLLAVHEEAVNQLFTVALGALSGLDETAEPLEWIEAPLMALCKALEANPAVARIAWYEALGVSDRVNAVIVSRLDDFANVVTEITKSLGVSPDGIAGPGGSVVLSQMIAGGINQLILRWIIGGFSPDAETLVPELAAILLGLRDLAIAIPPRHGRSESGPATADGR